MRFVLFLSALSCASVLAEDSVSKVAVTESKSSVRAFTPYGQTTLPISRVQLEIHTSKGKTERGTLVPADLFVTEHPERADNLDAAARASIGHIKRRALAGNLYGFDVKKIPIARETPLDLRAPHLNVGRATLPGIRK